MATGTAVSAGTFGQSTSSLAGTSGYGFHFSGVTLTGTGIIYQRGRIEAKDAARFKNQTASFSCKVYQDTGGAVNFTIYIRKANSADNFAAVTAIGNSGAVSIPDSTDTALKYEAISMGDCSAGIEYEIKGEVGAITTKNVYISEIQLEIGSVATAFEYKSYAHELHDCLEYYYHLNQTGNYVIGGYGICVSTTAAQVMIQLPVPMRTIPTLAGHNDLQLYTGITAIAVTNISIAANSSTVNVLIATEVAAGLTAGNLVELISAVTTADLKFAAEL